MLRALFERVPTGHLRGWLTLLLVCAALLGLRVITDSDRKRDEANWAKSEQLKRILGRAIGDRSVYVARDIFERDRKLDLQPSNLPLARVAVVDAETIGRQYKGWGISLRFLRGPDESLDEEILSSGQVDPPPGIILRQDPMPFWWTVEYFRVFMMEAPMVAWGAGMVLILCIRGVRRQVAGWCVTAAAVSMFAAALAVEFKWGRDFLLSSRWFESASAMALIAFFLSLFPSRRIDGSSACHNCHYDLTGNQSGICPECGTETPSHRRQMRLSELAPAADRLVNLVVPTPEVETEADSDSPDAVHSDESDLSPTEFGGESEDTSEQLLLNSTVLSSPGLDAHSSTPQSPS